MFETGRNIFLALIAISVLVAPKLSQAQITPELIEAAKKEGEVMFYGAITVNSSKAIGDAFEKKYGIKLHHWRGDATELIHEPCLPPVDLHRKALGWSGRGGRSHCAPYDGSNTY